MNNKSIVDAVDYLDEITDLLGGLRKRLDYELTQMVDEPNNAKQAFNSKLQPKVSAMREAVQEVESILGTWRPAMGGRRRKSRKANRKSRKTRKH